MKHNDYWRDRFVQLEQAQNRLAENGRQQIERFYRQAQRELDGQILVWYQRLADNNEISLAEARRWLNADELAEFKWDVQEYIKFGQQNSIDGQWVKQLENASAKFHISRLEVLKIRTRQSLETLFAKQQGVVGQTLGEVYRSGYYHTAFELQKGFSIGWDIAAVDERRLEKVLAKPLAADGRNFSERIWGNRDKLVSELHTELTRNIMLEQEPQRAIDAIARKMQTSKTNAGRLVMTEQAYFSSVAQRDCFHDLGVERFEIVATLDSHTSEICQELDGEVRPMSDYEPGVPAPPFHVNCRSTTVPYFDDEFNSIGERAARGDDGQTYYVPADMTYKEWAKSFAEGGGDKNGLQEVAESGIIKAGSGNVGIFSMDSPVEQRHTGKGNPNAVLLFDVELNNRQQKILEKLPEYDSRTVVPKKSANMPDLAALTAKTGDEFALFTKGSERLIIRGNACMVNIGLEEAKKLAKQGWRWSGHTHPGLDFLAMQPSDGDYEILNCFGQSSAVIYNSKGDFRTYEQRG